MNTLSSCKIFDTFNILSNRDNIGVDIANKNVEVFNRFKYFFITTKESCRAYSLIELAKFFDKNKRNQSLTILQVLDYSDKNINHLKEKDFLLHHKDRIIIPELFKSYREITREDINNLRKKILDKQEIIKRLLLYRDQYLAHDDLSKDQIKIDKKEVEEILDLIKGVIDFYYLKLDFASNCYKNFNEEPVEEMKELIKILQEHEEQRIKEIKTKY